MTISQDEYERQRRGWNAAHPVKSWEQACHDDGATAASADMENRFRAGNGGHHEQANQARAARSLRTSYPAHYGEQQPPKADIEAWQRGYAATYGTYAQPA